jgi:large subunit ribosomal protein L53
MCTNEGNVATEDGKEMKIDLEKMKIKDIQQEVDRHARGLRRVEELSGN